MIELSQNEIVDMVMNHIKKFGSLKTGTYNQADPTHFEKFHGQVWVEHGYTDAINNPIEIGGGYPMPEWIDIHFEDVTWGVNFKITTSKETVTAYWSRSLSKADGEWLRVDPNFFSVLKKIWKEGERDEPPQEMHHCYR